jgi:NAD(P)-dependent dehydrogenase (short-subunit alcohol dehydrogenase family)
MRTDIRVNAICPGLIESGMTIGTFDHARQRQTAGKIGQLNPLGRYGIAEGTSAWISIPEGAQNGCCRGSGACVVLRLR